MVAPKPSDPTNRSLLIVSPGTDLSLVSEGQSAKITLPNRLGFGTDPVPGVNGYGFWTGLLRRVHRIVNGYSPDDTNYPGTAAEGVPVEPRPPQKVSVIVGLKIKTANGVSLQSISDTIKTVVEGYINSLGLGDDVVLSEIIAAVQEVPGVDSVVMLTPDPIEERITINSNALARITSSDISLSQ